MVRNTSLFSSVQSLSRVQLFETLWTEAHQASLSITSSRSLLKLMSIESVISSNHLILCHPLLFLPSIFPSIRVFFIESVLHVRWPNYWSFNMQLAVIGSFSFCLMGESCTIVDLDHCLCFHFRWTLCLQVFAAVTGDAVQLWIHVPFVILLFSGYSLGVGLLDHRLLLFSFKGTWVLFCVRTLTGVTSPSPHRLCFFPGPLHQYSLKTYWWWPFRLGWSEPSS